MSDVYVLFNNFNQCQCVCIVCVCVCVCVEISQPTQVSGILIM